VDVKPNPLTLVVAIDRATKKVTLNNSEAGDVSDASALTAKLQDIFKQREANGVFREGTNEVEKTVFIKSSPAVKYGEVVRVIDAAKIAGATPIGLQVDSLEQ
jgi:biopolymer transport protein ExbD